MKRRLAYLLFVLAAVLALYLLPAPSRSPEDVVADLPGVGAGWLDTLRRVAGPAAIDTVSPLEFFDVPRDLLGLFERWHVLVSVNPHLPAYSRYIRDASEDWCTSSSGWFGPLYRHPLTMTNPAGVVAHEFGHRFQFSQWMHVPPQRGDTVPVWARDNIDERFADRFARAMLSLRGWDDPDPKDQVLTHRVRYLLMKSYWPAATVPHAIAPPDGTATRDSTRRHKAKKPAHRDF